MFLRISKFIGIFAITIVLLGHHSLQVHAMQSITPMESQDVGEREMEMEICEKIQSDEMQVSYDILMPSISRSFAQLKRKNHCDSQKFDNPVHKRISIDHQQLARSHLYV